VQQVDKYMWSCAKTGLFLQQSPQIVVLAAIFSKYQGTAEFGWER
jgi:hypothetical protein